jgi:hypothetical protein
MFVKWVFENMRIGEGVRTSKNIVVKFGDREDVVRLFPPFLATYDSTQSCNLLDLVANAFHCLE